MEIRRVDNKDAKEISELVNSLASYLMSEPEIALPQWLSESLGVEEFRERISSENYLAYVYELNGFIKGYIALKKPDHLYHLFVAEDCQRQGIAGSLWQHLLDTSEQTCFRVNASIKALHFYTKIGFKVSGHRCVKDGVLYQPMSFRRPGN